MNVSSSTSSGVRTTELLIAGVAAGTAAGAIYFGMQAIRSALWPSKPTVYYENSRDRDRSRGRSREGGRRRYGKRSTTRPWSRSPINSQVRTHPRNLSSCDRKDPPPMCTHTQTPQLIQL